MHAVQYDTQTGDPLRALGHSINVKGPNAMCNTKIEIDTVAYKVTKDALHYLFKHHAPPIMSLHLHLLSQSPANTHGTRR